MIPFNIRITNTGQNLTLTVLPTEAGYYKIIYYAAVLTAVQKTQNGDWILVTKDDIEAGDLPFYLPSADGDRLEPSLDKTFASAVGSAIELELDQKA
ncbi:hypothetical protein ACTHQF_16945 [Pedobacter sp. SAFR-022]|uniref:hypothetical protein n=1 Tax=Pedobacter sp. SAFR-022 TaxID=3436861 RepID=UPI003F81A568